MHQNNSFASALKHSCSKTFCIIHRKARDSFLFGKAKGCRPKMQLRKSLISDTFLGMLRNCLSVVSIDYLQITASEIHFYINCKKIQQLHISNELLLISFITEAVSI